MASSAFCPVGGPKSADGQQQWLNWVVRVPDGELAGYVQATVVQHHVAYVAYELASRFWRRGIGASAVGAAMQELVFRYSVRTCVAVLKTSNFRSLGLLRKLGFAKGSYKQAVTFGAGQDEMLMVKGAGERSS